MIKTKKRFSLIRMEIIGACLLVALVYMFCFYPQTEVLQGYSDTRCHIDWSRNLINNGDFPQKASIYPIFFWSIGIIGKLIGNYDIATIIWTGVFSAITCLLQIMVLKKLTKNNVSTHSIILIGALLSFAWPIDITLSLIRERAWPLSLYLMSGATAPAHNLTYLCSKPFALICAYLYINLFEKQDDSRTKDLTRDLFLLSAFLFISVLAKPNFYQCFVPAGALWAVGDFIKNKNKAAFLFCCKIALSFLPATSWVLYSMTKKLNPFAWSPLEGIKIFNANFPIGLTIFRAFAFVCVVLLICLFTKSCNKFILFPVLVLLFGLAEFLLLIEPAEKGSLNMMWGYNCGMYIAFVFACAVLFNLKNKIYKAAYYSSWVVFAWHAGIGLYAFITYQWGNWLEIFKI